MDQKPNPFPVDCVVTWNPEAPSVWRLIWTPGPMIVVGTYWHSGEPSSYALKFGANGMDITPGWILTVEHGADDTRYYDPPLSRVLGNERIKKDIHEKWLMRYVK